MARPNARQRSRQRVDPETKLTKQILKMGIVPPVQVRRGDFDLHDVANHSEADQRHMVRSKETQTVRRKSHLEKLCSRKAITPDQFRICQWYADQYEAGFATVGCTANYMGAGGGGFGAKDLFARYEAQLAARENYAMAKATISRPLISLFERVVIHQTPINEGGRCTRLSLSFRLAVRQLESGVGHMLSFE